MTMRGILTKLMALACAVAAVAEEPGKTEAAPEPELTAEEILANPLDDDAYQQSSRCLPTGKYRHVEVLNNQVLVFHGRGEEIWLNILPNRCLGLEADMVLEIEKRGMRLCSRDQFRGLPRFRPNQAGSMPCTLGDFHATPKENVAAMRDALEANQRTKTVGKTVRSAGRDSESEGEPESESSG